QNLTPGQIAEEYAKNNYGVTFQFSELTNGRFDKHVYDPKWKPGAQYEQEMHPFWQQLVACADLPRDENNLPNHHEASPWSDPPQTVDDSKPGFSGLQGNFEKFLISRDGHSFERYANGFLLGERDPRGAYFPWWVDQSKRSGQSYPTTQQKRGITESLAILCADIDALLGETAERKSPPRQEWTLPTEIVKSDHKDYGDKFQVGKGVQEVI
ncbi:MAG: hypothetical protein VX895_05740, partial [Chloroflexota bacterium]|nr:hypothetical protein [Chloroflexota bacterium]